MGEARDSMMLPLGLFSTKAVPGERGGVLGLMGWVRVLWLGEVGVACSFDWKSGLGPA